MLGGVTRHRVTSPTCGPPPSCKQALNDNEIDNDTRLQVYGIAPSKAYYESK